MDRTTLKETSLGERAEPISDAGPSSRFRPDHHEMSNC
jgi:hypothetical protein